MDRFSHNLPRRQVIQSLACGSLLLPGVVSELLAGDAPLAAPPRTVQPEIAPAVDPVAPRAAHMVPRAKRVIYLYMSGGVSHLESFDPKPKLAADAGKKFKDRTLLAPQFKFSPAGQCGTPVSELFPNVAACADDLCVIRSMTGSHF